MDQKEAQFQLYTLPDPNDVYKMYSMLGAIPYFYEVKIRIDRSVQRISTNFENKIEWTNEIPKKCNFVQLTVNILTMSIFK